MAQTIVTLCDPCLMEGKEAPAQTWALTIQAPGSKAAPYEIDVCDMHAEPYRILVSHLGEDGRRADRKRPLPTVTPPGTGTGTVAPRAESMGPGLTCPVCGHQTPTEGGMNSHCRTEHGVTLAEAAGAASLTCPVAGCDRHFKARQGQIAHMRVTHRIDAPEAREMLDGAA